MQIHWRLFLLQCEPDFLLNEELGNSSGSNQNNLYRNILVSALIILALGLGIFIIRHYSLNERLPVYLADSYKRRGSVPPRWVNRWVRWTNLSPIERAFQAINLSLFWLGHSQPADVTSQKRAEVLIECLPSAQDQTLSLLAGISHGNVYTTRRKYSHRPKSRHDHPAKDLANSSEKSVAISRYPL